MVAHCRSGMLPLQSVKYMCSCKLADAQTRSSGVVKSREKKSLDRNFFFRIFFDFFAMSLREGGKEFVDEGGRGLEWLKNFDVFPKTVDDAKEVSVSGGSVLLFV